METKYTTDGKKVAVIGNLNSQEKIVQEIFIVNGQEIPSGENFVVKSLHDAPVKSFLDTKKEQLEKEIKNLEGKLKEEQEYLNRRKTILRHKIEEANQKIEFYGKFCEIDNLKQFNHLKKVFLGEYKYVLVKSNYEYKIQTLEEFSIWNEYGIKLINIYGKTNGDLSIYLNTYRDESGSKCEIMFFDNEQDAIGYIREDILKKEFINSYDIKYIKEYKFLGFDEKIKFFKQKQINEIDSNIARSELSIKDYNNKKIEIELI